MTASNLSRALLLLLSIVVQVCGQGPATTPENLAAALFEGEPGSQAETVQGMFTACSHGNADFSRASGSEVVSVTVPIACTGNTPWGAPYDSMLCPFTGERLLGVFPAEAQGVASTSPQLASHK